MTQEKEIKEANQLTKGLLDILGSEVIDFDDERITDEEAMIVASDAERFYKTHFEKRLKLLAFKHLKHNAISETEGSTLFFKGALYGLKEIQDWFDTQISLSNSKFDKEDDIIGIPTIDND